MLATLPLPGGGRAALSVEGRKELRPSLFHAMTNQAVAPKGRFKAVVPTLALPSVSPRLAELCEEKGWSWFDLAGNCRIDIPGFLQIRHSGNKPLLERQRPAANLSTPEAGRIIRALLSPQHTGVRWTQRRLAAHFGELVPPLPEPSAGLVNKVVRHLRDEAFLEPGENGGFHLRDPLKLLLAWRDVYRFDRHERLGYFTLLQKQD